MHIRRIVCIARSLSSSLTIRLSCIIVVAIIRILNLFLSFANYQRIKMSIMLSIIWSTSPFNLVSLIKLRCINATNFRDLYLRIYVLCVFVYGEQTKNIIKFSLHVYVSMGARGYIVCGIYGTISAGYCCNCIPCRE